LDSGEDYVHTLKNYDSSEEYEDFDNLTLSRAGFKERAINTCDCAPVSSSDRIVGGKEVNPKFKLPYQVLVSPCNSNGGCMMCGGTILNKRYVVTAAHCLYDGSNQLTVKGGAKFRVMVGEHDHCKHNEAGGKSYVLASAVHKHPKFDPNVSPDNDIAILKLSKDLTFSDKIKPACLPTSATKDYSGELKEGFDRFHFEKNIFYHDGYLFLPMQTWRVLVNHSSYFHRQAKLPLSLDGEAPRRTNPSLLSTSLGSVDSKRASSTFSSQLTKSAKTSWVTLPPPPKCAPGPRVQTPARVIVVDHLQLLRTESTCSLA